MNSVAELRPLVPPGNNNPPAAKRASVLYRSDGALKCSLPVRETIRKAAVLHDLSASVPLWFIPSR